MKNWVFDHPLAPEDCQWLKLSLNDLFITMKWQLTYLEYICCFLLSPCVNRRLYISPI